MHEYYFKIKKADIEFECSTSDKVLFEEKLSDWINGIIHSVEIESTQEGSSKNEVVSDSETKPQRLGFIDVKNLISINEMSSQSFNKNAILNEDKNKELVSTIDFEQALTESIQNPKTEVIEKQESLTDFEYYLTAHNPLNDMDRLIVTAKYIQNVENLECFSVKQINAKLVPLTNSPITHLVIEEALNQKLLRILPDLTGTSEYTEYTLTEDGELYFID